MQFISYKRFQTSKRKLISALTVIGIALAASACDVGGGGGDDEETAPESFRVIHAAPDLGTLDVTIDDEEEESATETTRVNSTAKSSSLLKTQLVLDGLEYQHASGYVEALEGTRVIEVHDRHTAAPIVSEEQTIEAGKSYTYVVFESEDEITTLFQEDNNEAPDSGEFKIRIGQFSEAAGAVDAYVVRSGRGIRNVEPVATGLEAGGFSEYIGAPVGSYEIKFTTTETKDVIEDGGEFSFVEGDIATVVLLDKKRGGKPLETELFLDVAGEE